MQGSYASGDRRANETEQRRLDPNSREITCVTLRVRATTYPAFAGSAFAEGIRTGSFLF